MNYQKDYWNKMFRDNLLKNTVRTNPSKLGVKAFEIALERDFNSILDLGCGQGRDSLFFIQKKFKVCSVDTSKVAIEYVSKRSKELGCNNLEILNKDIRDELNFKENTFDMVFSNHVFHFLNNVELKKIINNISKWLKPEGLLICSIKRSGDKYYGVGKKIDHNTYVYENVIRCFRTENEIIGLLNSKFAILEIREEIEMDLDKSFSMWYGVISKNQK